MTRMAGRAMGTRPMIEHVGCVGRAKRPGGRSET